MIKYLAMALGVLVVGGTVFSYVPYRRDIQAAYQRLDGLESQLVETPCGQIEYAAYGEGDPVLLVHGNPGGFDQGLDLGADHLAEGFMGIAPSRFGYLGTPLPKGATPGTQADAFVCLLDELGIERVGVIAWSAGGMSAVQLALRHPERVSALVLVATGVSDVDRSGDVRLPPEPVLRAVFGSDYLFWLLTKPFRPLFQRMFIPTTYGLTAEDRAFVDEAFQNILPVGPRTQGAVFDILVTITDSHRNSSNYHLEEMTVPTLVIAARDDPAVNYDDVRVMTQRMPRARLVTIATGGHLMLGSGKLVRTEINAFLREHVDAR